MNGKRGLFSAMVMTLTLLHVTVINAATFLEEAMIVRKSNNSSQVDISYLAERFFPIGEDANLALERMTRNGLQVWKESPKRKFIGGSYKPKTRLLTYDEYRLIIELDDNRKTARVKAWIFFHSF